MGRQKQQQGFTIIEVMLFLAVTALLIMGILGSVSNSINVQRYREGVEGFRDFLAGQYESINMLTNDRTATQVCGGIQGHRGATDCFYSGKLIEIGPGETGAQEGRIEVSPVIAIKNTVPSPPPNDYTYKKVLEGNPGNVNIVTKEIDWGLFARESGTTTFDGNYYILITRHPDTGVTTVVTRKTVFTGGSNSGDGLQDLPASPAAMALSTPSQDLKMCMIDKFNGLNPPEILAVMIKASTTNPADIEVKSGECPR